MDDTTMGRAGVNLKNNKGFSLLEIMTVLSIMAILSVISTPKIVSQRAAAQRRAATSQFISAHSLTRVTAIRYGRRAEFHIDPSGLMFHVVVDTGQTAGVADTIRTVFLPNSSLTMYSDRAVLCFDARGLATTVGACETADALVRFVEPGKTDTVAFTALGQVIR